MATDLRKTKNARAAVAAKHDSFVQAQLTRAERRIRLLDAGAALLGFAALLCVFLVAAALCDRAWSLPAWVRQVGLVGFLLGGGVYLYFTLGRPLLYRLNPYYAAQLVEQTMPGAKNSVVNWLDLQHQNLPPAIHAAVGQKAAKDLAKTDVDRAFSARRVLWAGVVAAVCAIVFVACLVRVGGGSFYRVMAPFSFSSPEAPTQITITKPLNGDDTVTIDQAVTISAHLEGKIPDKVQVLFRSQEGDPYKTAIVTRQDRDFTAVIQPRDLGNGFLYKVVAGNVETPEYRITVRARPLLSRVEATYHFRPYLGWLDELHFGRSTFKMEAWRGTEILMEVRTNRPVKDAAVVLEFPDGSREERLVARTLADNPNAFQVKFPVDRSARYHLEYTTPEGERFYDLNPQEIVAKIDQPPQTADLTVPGRNTQLPCNGVLQVEGSATDDIGVKGLTLRMREVTQKIELQGKPYRSDKELRLTTGGYALKLAYKDYVDLNTMQTPDGKLLALQKDMVLEYWLEASDACDFPTPNPVVESKHYHVTLLPPEKDQQNLNDQREQAKQEQRKHEQKQDEALRKEGQTRAEEQQRHNEDMNRDKNGGESGQPKSADEKTGGAEKNKEDILRQADQIQKELDKERQRQEQKSEGKSGPQQPPAQAKDGGQGEQKPQPGQAKPEGSKPENPQNAGENKPAGQQSDPKNAPGEAKSDGKPDPSQKPGQNKPDKSPPNGTPKSEPKQQPTPQPQPDQRGEAKSAPSPQEKKETGENKPDAKPNSQECTKADCKNGGTTTNPDAKNAEPKPKPAPAPNTAEGKNAGPSNQGNDPKAQQKPGGSPMSGEAKPDSPPQKDDVARGEAKKDSPSGDPGAAKAEDVQKEAANLKSDDAQKRQDAAKQLEKIAKQAKDEQARQDAQKALDDAGVKEQQPGQTKGPPEKKESQGTIAKEFGEKKGKEIEKEGPKSGLAEAKPGPGELSPAAPKDLGQPQIHDDKVPVPKDPQDKEQQRRQREEQLEKLKQDLKNKGEFDEKKWKEFLERYAEKIDPRDVAMNKTRDVTVPPPSGPGGEDSPEVKNGEHREQKASMLQLREFLKSVDPQVLKEAGVSEDKWREFLKNYADLAIREELKKETLPAPKVGGQMQGTGGKRVNPGATSDSNAMSGSGRSQAPPGYRDAWKQFTRDLNSTDDKK